MNLNLSDFLFRALVNASYRTDDAQGTSRAGASDHGGRAHRHGGGGTASSASGPLGCKVNFAQACLCELVGTRAAQSLGHTHDHARIASGPAHAPGRPNAH